MPKELENKLRAEAEKIYPGDKEAQDRYVYGSLTTIEKRQEHPETHWFWKPRKRK